MDQHELIAALKDLALELGRTPTRSEFIGRVAGGAYQLTRVFGTYSLMLKAGGLDTYDDRRKARKIDGSIFQRDIEQHVEAYKPREFSERKPWPKIAILPDVHFPWENKKVLEAFYKFVEVNQPEHIVQIGDLYDAYSHAKFPRSHNQFTPREETDLSRGKAVAMWDAIKKAAPKATRYQILGNHDIRPLKRILEVYPEAEDWIKNEVHKLMTFDGVTTMFDPREELIIGDIAILHGYRSQLGQHRDFTLMNCVTGHSHVGGAVFRQIQGRVLWELNAGFAADPEGKGLTYTSQKLSRWTPGFGWIDSYGPRFVPV